MPSERSDPDPAAPPRAERLRLDARAYPPTGRLVPVAGRRVHVHEAGAGPAVVLLHGASGNGRDYTFDLVGRLAPRYRVIVPDRPGLGHSDALHGRGESPQEQAAHLDAALEALDVGRAVVVGHSYGGAVALAWALVRPDRVAAVVSLSGAAMPWRGGLGPWYPLVDSWLGGRLVVPAVSALATRSMARQAIAAVFAPQAPPPGYAAHIGVGLTLRPASLRANARQLHHLKPHIRAMAERYHALDRPVEILHGARDTIVPLAVHGGPLAEIAPGARLTVLDGIGHMPHHSAPDAAVAAIDRAAARAGLH